MDLVKSNLYEDLVTDDIIGGHVGVEGMMQLLDAGAYHIGPDGKITNNGHIGASWNTPWIFQNVEESMNCTLWHRIMFDKFKIIPKGCMNCFKVVVRPRSVEELFKLADVEETLYPHHCKCGTEHRNYVFGNYGGYFYCTGIEDGQEKLGIVKDLVGRHISPDIPVYLKRFCTEYEVAFGRSDQVKYSPEWAVKEEQVKDCFNLINEEYPQTEEIKTFIKRRWLEHAYSIGDETVFKFNEGKPFFSPPVVYDNYDPNLMREV